MRNTLRGRAEGAHIFAAMPRELEVVADILEDGRDLWAKQDQRANDDNRDQRDNQRVLNEALTPIET